MVIIVLLLCTVIGMTSVYSSDIAEETNSSYRVAIDPVGNMRLLNTDINGKYNDEPKSNEFVIEFASMERKMHFGPCMDFQKQVIEKLKLSF